MPNHRRTIRKCEVQSVLGLIENSDKKVTIPELSGEDIRQLENYRSISDDTLGRILRQAENRSSFTYRDLTDITEKDAQDLLTICFTKKGAFTTSCTHAEHELRYEHFLSKMQMFWPLFLEHSFGILDNDGRLVAVVAQVDDFEIPRDAKDLEQIPTTQVDKAFGYITRLEYKAAPQMPTIDKKGNYHCNHFIFFRICSAKECFYFLI